MYTKSYNLRTFFKNIDASQVSVFKHHLDSLISLTKAIESTVHLDELLERIMHDSIIVTGAARGFLFLYSYNQESLTLEVMHGVSEELRKEDYSFENYRVSREIIKFVENTGKAVIGSHEKSSIAQQFSDLKHYGVSEALCVPFQSRGKTLGFLYLDHAFDRKMFSIQELELMKSFTTLTSLSMENAYLARRLEGQQRKHISITIEENPSMHISIISIEGSLDFVTMGQLDKKCLPFLESKTQDIIIDISNMDYVSKSGILCLLKYFILIKNMKGALKFIRPPQHVCKKFDIVGISKRIEMYNNIEEAVSTL
jgi:anti-anti-sigma factor